MWFSSLSDKQLSALVGLAHNVVVSDGLLDPNEEFMLDEFKREMALSGKSGNGYLELESHEIASTFDSPRTRRIAMINLLRLSYVDGEFDVEEKCLLQQVAETFQIDPGEFQRMDNWVRRLVALENEANLQFLSD